MRKEVFDLNLMGLDIGTTGCKAMVFTDQGEALGHGFREYQVISLDSVHHEQDAERVWNLAKEAMKEAIDKSGATQVQALSISVQGDAVIPVDISGNALSYTILGMDYRSTEQSKRCSELFGARELFQKTGMRPHPMNSVTKILWIKENLPDIYEKAYKLVTYADFILMKLGAPAVIDETMASRTMLFDLNTKTWSAELLQKLDIDLQKLSEVVPSGVIVGEMSPLLKEELGLQGTVQLVSGGHDQTCAALGAGLVKENIALDSHGTAEVISTAFLAPHIDDNMFESYYPCYRHAKSGMYFTFTLNHIGGILFKWFRDNFCEKEMEEAALLDGNAFKLLESKAPDDPSSVMILPHFNGSGTPWCDLDSKGAIVGLTMSTTKYDIVKAVMDSLTYELRINLDRLERRGIQIDTLRAVGGATKSPKWMQIKADITGKAVQTLQISDAACLGGAMLAGAACGAFSSLDEAVDQCVHIKTCFEPDPKRGMLYQEKYEVYCDLYPTLRKLNYCL
ncbi:FGGY-family carbohydrate kinase [Massiliimalia timonensis]|uniref:FGGY-family carbohydrate kinase n=1 Tax=Massiliimalia timonensis TaxID=1987501 RepID=UPI00189EAB28|nr:FGGY-family carbohydrate kinase [Massiliimalia timonensis]